MENIAEQVNKNVEEFLSTHGFKLRDSAQQNVLKDQIKDLASMEHSVTKIMCKLQ